MRALLAIACVSVAPYSLAQSGAAQEEREYIGSELCLTCHRDLDTAFSHTAHSLLLDAPRNELEARGCESCHGPGSVHLRNAAEPGSIIRFSKNSAHSISEQNDSCLACHDGGHRMHWPGSMHERADVACSDCHNPMANVSGSSLLRAQTVNETCFGCHKEQRAEFNRRSHMPLLEGQLNCVDCHNPHGSIADSLVKADTTNDLCYTCHAELRGPFLFEHAPVRENCMNCHLPHGSNHDKLLVTARPILCQQCHSVSLHNSELLTSGGLPGGSLPDVRVIGRSCTNCHAQVHGSNHPSGSRLHR